MRNKGTPGDVRSARPDAAYGRFVVIPDRLLRGVPAETVAVYAVVASYADRDRMAWPSKPRIAAALGRTGLRQVHDHLETLRRAHALEIHRSRIGQRTRNVYTLPMPAGWVQLPTGIIERMAAPASSPDRLRPEHVLHWLRWRHLAGPSLRTSIALPEFAARYGGTERTARRRRGDLERAGLLTLERRAGAASVVAVLVAGSVIHTPDTNRRSPRTQTADHPGHKPPITPDINRRSPRTQTADELDSLELDSLELDTRGLPHETHQSAREGERANEESLSTPNLRTHVAPHGAPERLDTEAADDDRKPRTEQTSDEELTTERALTILRGRPDWGRGLIRRAPTGLTRDEATIWAARHHLERMTP